MKTLLGLLALVSLTAVPTARADKVIQTFPPGSAQEAMDKADKDTNNPVGQAGGTLVIDEDCAKKTMHDGKLAKGKPTPEYEACVKGKLDAKKKTMTH